MIAFENTAIGTKAIIKTEWKDSFLKKLLRKDIKELILNQEKGWRGKNLDFLESLPNLQSLSLLDLSIDSIKGVHFLNNLEQLTLITYAKESIDFDCFPKLTHCSFEWIKGSESLFKLSNLQKLFINRYNKKHSSVFSEFNNLEELSVLNSTIEDLKGIFILKNLKSIRLGNLRKIVSLDGIQNLKLLEKLEIQSCKNINDVSNLFQLKELKRLLLLDVKDIENIKGISNLVNLEEFLFYGSTNIKNGDLSEILNLKKLSNIAFQNRKHYSHKNEYFENLL